ncbi:YlmH/Sll1252 family protein [Clostridium sp. BJN0001]|uniref:YlmH family RNA-binding protein n=1 Tax=Clostridium sp. BJN0001 TaxID=2930219 RepID=UPI001FD3F158|nr:YlmH/Sll1252 family protein [Clostridium sp. BJN0001]
MITDELLSNFSKSDADIILSLSKKCSYSKNRNIVVCSDKFYTPCIWKYIMDKFSDDYFTIHVNGCFDEAERRMILFNSSDKNDFNMDLLKIEVSSKFDKIVHRDFLGALLSLGIERDRVGDLIVKNNVCYIPVVKDLSEYIILNLTKIKNSRCKISYCDINSSDIQYEFIENIINVSSARIDNIVSKVVNLSRQKALNLIEYGKVLVDYNEIRQKSFIVKEGDRVTVRGFGKFIIGGLLGNTKKGKMRILIKKYN